MKNSNYRRRIGFSLIELISVIAIMLILIAAVGVAFNHVGNATQLSTGGGIVVDTLTMARQTALARNRVVEVRFYQIPHGGTTAYKGIQTFLLSEDEGHTVALDGFTRLPGAIVFDATEEYSTILSSQNELFSGNQDIPGVKEAFYRVIRFTPSGGTHLSPSGTTTSDPWFVTLKRDTDPQAEGKPAKNFITAQIDPVSGRVITFRP